MRPGWLPAVTLVPLSPIIAEFLLGDSLVALA